MNAEKYVNLAVLPSTRNRIKQLAKKYKRKIYGVVDELAMDGEKILNKNTNIDRRNQSKGETKK